jgi:spore maturation protein SpmA
VNIVFFGIVALSFLFAVINGTPEAVGSAALSSAKASVELAIGLIGYICLFLGLMKVVEEAGGLKFMARLIRPLLVRLFPDIPPEHPAMGAMVMNIAANALGLGNAATPFGLKAMKELDTLNKEKGTATNAMILFLGINTSGLALLPTGIIGLREYYGSVDPAAIFPTTLLATACSTLVAVFVAKTLQKLPIFQAPAVQQTADKQIAGASEKEKLRDLIPLVLFFCGLAALVVVVAVLGEKASAWILPGLVFGMLLVGVLAKVKVYEAFVLGAKEGFDLAVMIIPYLVAILASIGMLRASGGLDVIVGWVAGFTSPFGLPAEALPLALLRPLSGSGAYGITAELVQTHGPDGYIGQLVSTMNGSTETTFYVLAVYFGSVGISRLRHAVPVGLAADLTGVIASVMAVKLLLTPIAPEVAPVQPAEQVMDEQEVQQ